MDLTQYDVKPVAMVNYLRYNGPHFSKALAEFAIKKMRKDKKQLQPITEEQMDTIFKSANIQIQNNNLYDAWYVINMAKADFFGSSITTDQNLAKFVKDYLDDEDGYDGIAFNRFLADCARKGVVINWERMI